MSNILTLPPGSFDEFVRGPYGPLIVDLASACNEVEKALLTIYAESQGRPMPEAVATVARAQIARMAWAMSSAAEIRGLVFDPVLFGEAAETIGREQIERYRTATETAGRA